MPTTTITTAPNVAAIANLTMDQGASFSTVITVYQDDSILDLAGYSVAAQIRKSYSSSSSTSFTTAKVSATDGTCSIALTDTVTGALSIGRYVWDLTTTDSSGLITRRIEGRATITPSVSR